MAYAAFSVVYAEQPSAAKWNILGTNDAHFYGFLGDNEDWQTWSPTLTNLSGGTVNYAKYTQVGNTTFFMFKYTLAGAGVAGSVGISPPVNFAADMTTDRDVVQTNGILYDANGSRWKPWVLWAAANRMTIGYLTAADIYANLSSTLPFTWASPDEIMICGTYRSV